METVSVRGAKAWLFAGRTSASQSREPLRHEVGGILPILRCPAFPPSHRQAYALKTMSDKTINEAASRLLKNSKVAARISELTAPALKSAGLTVGRTLREVARISYSDPRRLCREDSSLKPPDEWDDDTAASVASFEVSEEFSGCGDERKLTGYTKKVKFWDKHAALDEALKHLGLYERDSSQRAPNLALQIVTAGRE
jgi:hypothetical protein